MTIRLLPSIAVISLSAIGCLDLNATEVAPAPDAQATTNQMAQCQACIVRPASQGPGCGDTLAECGKVPACLRSYYCTLAANCYAGTQSDLIQCGLPCAFDAGIQSADDPALAQAAALFQCIGGVCGPECFGNR